MTKILDMKRYMLIDETLPIIKKKPKHPEKGEHKEQNESTHVQKDK
jgi:hypothetical protein